MVTRAALLATQRNARELARQPRRRGAHTGRGSLVRRRWQSGRWRIKLAAAQGRGRGSAGGGAAARTASSHGRGDRRDDGRGRGRRGAGGLAADGRAAAGEGRRIHHACRRQRQLHELAGREREVRHVRAGATARAAHRLLGRHALRDRAEVFPDADRDGAVHVLRLRAAAVLRHPGLGQPRLLLVRAAQRGDGHRHLQRPRRAHLRDGVRRASAAPPRRWPAVFVADRALSVWARRT